MALRDIMLHLDTGERCAERTRLAIHLAARDGAHLAGVFVVDVPPPGMTAGYEMAYAMGGSDSLFEQLRTQAIATAEPVRASFEAALRAAGVSGEWRMVEGLAPELLALHARYADLAIIGQPDPGAPYGTTAQDVTVSALLTSGRPVLSVPYAGRFPTLTGHALVAWNASREAARAVNDALPLLRACQKVTVLAINPEQGTSERGIRGHGDMPAADICLHLARHGINATAAQTVAPDISEGDALLSYAADISAELVVMGAYGHSRLREWAFGGVTRTMLRSMTLPVFMSA